MNQTGRPNPAQVPTLTEVIELLNLTPVGEEGMHHAPCSPAPAPGSAGSAPIVTSGLSSSQAPSHWTPMSTVVLSSLGSAPVPPMVSMADLPVLEAVVYEPALGPEPVASTVLPVAAPMLAPVASAQGAETTRPSLPDVTESQLAQRVLADVQKQIDGMLDFRLREAMAPILARHSDALVRDLREELKRTMQDVVTRSVAQEMAKLRQR
jgi:hypothetical protein